MYIRGAIVIDSSSLTQLRRALCCFALGDIRVVVLKAAQRALLLRPFEFIPQNQR